AVAGEVAGSGERPTGGDRADVDVRGKARGESVAGRLPFGERRAVLPDKVARAVTVEIGIGRERPTGRNRAHVAVGREAVNGCRLPDGERAVVEPEKVR